MARKFKITEAQRDALLSEGVAIATLKGKTDSSGKADINGTAKQINNLGGDPTKFNVEYDGAAITGQTNGLGEHRIITKKQLQANRLRYLKENSEILSLNNFMKKLH